MQQTTTKNRNGIETKETVGLVWGWFGFFFFLARTRATTKKKE